MRTPTTKASKSPTPRWPSSTSCQPNFMASGTTPFIHGNPRIDAVNLSRTLSRHGEQDEREDSESLSHEAGAVAERDATTDAAYGQRRSGCQRLTAWTLPVLA